MIICGCRSRPLQPRVLLLLGHGYNQRHHRLDAGFAVALVRWLSVRHGIRHVRLTVGEPLLYPELLDLVAGLASLGTLDEITLTTNGQTLATNARALHRAGLTRVNVSLDTLVPERFAQVTRGGRVVRTLQGVEAALEARLTPVRLNVVAHRGLNDDELCTSTSGALPRVYRAVSRDDAIGPMRGALQDLLVLPLRISIIWASASARPVVRQRSAAKDYTAATCTDGPSGVIGVIAHDSAILFAVPPPPHHCARRDPLVYLPTRLQSFCSLGWAYGR